MTRLAVPHMEAAGGGAIVNVGTMTTRKPMQGEGGYALAKAAMTCATQFLALELGPKNIRVVSVSPGLIATEAITEYVEALSPEQRRTELGRYDEQIPLRRIGRPEEIADLCVFLASDRASFVHGTDVSADGGMFALNKAFSYNP